MLEAFLYTAMGRGNDGALDRLLDGPTNEAWIDPWLEHLTRLGVRFRVGWSAEDLDYTNGRIAAALVTDPGRIRRRVEADWFVCAVPIERAVRLWNPQILAADPRLVLATGLETEWMVGLQLYLRRQTPIAHGHVNYVDSPWVLTSISQAQPRPCPTATSPRGSCRTKRSTWSTRPLRRLCMKIASRPVEIDEVERAVRRLEIEEMALAKESDPASVQRLAALRAELADRRERLAGLTTRWQNEKCVIKAARELKEQLEQLRGESERTERDGDLGRGAGAGRH